MWPQYFLLLTLIFIILFKVKFDYATAPKIYHRITQVLFILYFIFLVNSFYFLNLTKRMIERNISYLCHLFLQGVQAWAFFENNLFTRIGKYIGHGLCYEATALTMLGWHDNKNTCIVFGECYSDIYNEHVKHCWMEVKVYGVWWVIDPTWFHSFPEPRWYYYLIHRTRRERIISHKEFWNSNITNTFYQYLKDPETSYLFHELVYFRRNHQNDIKMVFEEFEMSEIKNDGTKFRLELLDIFKRGRPVTYRIINEFLANPSRTLPKRRTYRKAMRLLKTRNEAIKSAEKLYKETGKFIEIVVDSITEYTLKEKEASLEISLSSA